VQLKTEAKSTLTMKHHCKKTRVSILVPDTMPDTIGYSQNGEGSTTRIKKAPPKWGLINLKGQVMKPPHCLE